ncbi:MAG: AraC family transcriptional regulator [Microbacterium sp.]
MAEHETTSLRVRGTTRGLPRGADYDAFCDGIADVYVGVRPERPARGSFAADFGLYEVGPLSLGIISTPGADAHRDRRSISRIADDAVFVNHSRRPWALRQHGEFPVAAGAGVVLDNGTPFSVLTDPRHRLDLVSLRIPRDRLPAAATRDLGALGRRLAASPRGMQLGAQVGLLADAVRDGLPSVARAMAAVVVELLDAAGTDSGGTAASARVDVFRAHARAHMLSPGYGLAALARAFSCSQRTVQAAFAQEGETFSQWLRAERLDAARAALRDGDARPVEAIAHGHGFADVGTFHRAYRARFGRSPGSDR